MYNIMAGGAEDTGQDDKYYKKTMGRITIIEEEVRYSRLPFGATINGCGGTAEAVGSSDVVGVSDKTGKCFDQSTTEAQTGAK